MGKYSNAEVASRESESVTGNARNSRRDVRLELNMIKHGMNDSAASHVGNTDTRMAFPRTHAAGKVHIH